MLGNLVERTHFGSAQAAFEAPKSLDRSRWSIQAKEEYHSILREKFEIVRQDYQIIFINSSVPNTSVFYIDVTPEESQITQCIVDAPNVRHAQPVPLVQQSPTVVSVQEFVG